MERQQRKTMGKVIIFSAPSGSGKSTIVNALLKETPQLEFSISATSRQPRGTEQNGVEYYFFTNEEFKSKIANDEFLEWEEVYAGTSYGTLKAEIERIWNRGNIVIFDVDVVGGMNIKQLFGNDAMSLFIMPPSIEELRNRLVGRATDTPEAIEKRIAKATKELEYAPKFDHMIVNDNLNEAIAQTRTLVTQFIK